MLSLLSFILLITCSKDDKTPALAITSISPAQGTSGSTINLTGIGFGTSVSENIVLLNGKTCIVKSASTTQLRITIPIGASTGRLQVTVGNQTAFSSLFTCEASVYVAGSEAIDATNLTNDVAKYWMNDSAVSLSYIWYSTEANSIFVTDNDVYVAGSEPIGTNTYYLAMYWKNGTAVRLSDGSKNASAKSIFVSDNDVYAAGFE